MGELVSILIPCYNAKPWVAQAIESALSQTWANKEVIVLDDGSTDGSLEVIRRYEGRIQIATQPNGGQNVSRNHLTRLSRGEWLFYLDADDELMPDNVEQKLKLSAGAVAVYGSMDIATFSGAQRLTSGKRLAQDFEDAWLAAFGWKFPNTSAFAFERHALLAAGGWDETVKNCTDYALYFPLLLRGGRFKAAPHAWSLYRQWSITQAVNEAPIRKMATRLRVMRAAAESLKAQGQLTPSREQAFLDACLAVLRSLFSVDAASALDEHRKIREWNPRFKPSAAAFPAAYCRAYQLLGFAAAERIAEMSRALFRRPV